MTYRIVLWEVLMRSLNIIATLKENHVELLFAFNVKHWEKVRSDNNLSGEKSSIESS